MDPMLDQLIVSQIKGANEILFHVDPSYWYSPWNGTANSNHKNEPNVSQIKGAADGTPRRKYFRWLTITQR